MTAREQQTMTTHERQLQIEMYERADYDALKMLEFYRMKLDSMSMFEDAKKRNDIEKEIGAIQMSRQAITTEMSALKREMVNQPISAALGVKTLAR